LGFRILVIDDEPTLRESLQIALTASGYELKTARTGEEGLELFARESPDLVLLDHWLPGINGDQVLQRIKDANPEIPVIIMTAQGSVDLAVQSMKMGAFDFLVKPFELDQIEALVQKGLERTRLKKELEWLRAQYREKFRSGGIVGASPKMKEILELAEKLAASSDTTVLIEGETGTGKELLAEYLHSLSPRASFPFIPVNCGAFPQELLESELFGYERGAFTGASEKGKAGRLESAEKGTLFLDEVGELPPPAQVKILRVLEEKEYFKLGSVEKKKADVRFIAATNKELNQEIAEKRFREDLYYRLNVVPIAMPALRDRKDDIPVLVQAFLDEFCHLHNKDCKKVADATLELMLNYAWPGNVRELRNAVERMVLLSGAKTLEPRDLPPPIRRDQNPRPQITIPLDTPLEEVEKTMIRSIFSHITRNRRIAAETLGISLRALHYKIRRFNLDRE